MLKTIAVALLLGSCAAQQNNCADIAQNNGQVDIEDLLAILSAYGSTNAKVNLVGSAKVDIEDLLAVLGQYGSKCKRNTGGGGGAFKGCKAGAKCGPFIAEAAEGTGHNKYLEFYNPTDQVIKLDQYGFPNSNNGDADGNPNTPDYWNAFKKGATIKPGEVYVVCHSSADKKIKEHCDQTHNYLSNGDDGYCLAKIKGKANGKKTKYDFVDCVGDFGKDPGSGWAVCGTKSATKEKTLVRKCGVTVGAKYNWKASAGTNKNNCQWEVKATNFWDAAGYHRKCGAPAPPPPPAYQGMYVDVYAYKAGWRLASLEHPKRENWNDMTPLASHFEIRSKMWYSNDKDFAKEIPGFNRNNKYMMRFRGYYVAASAGTYGFQTCSDDGSMIYIKDKLVVNNDGDHGRKCKSANVKLTKGWNKLTVTFYENGGGAALQCSVKVPKGKWTPITAIMTRPAFRGGLRLDTFHYKGGQIKDWDKYIHSDEWQPSSKNAVANKKFTQQWAQTKDVWYSSDNDFKKLVPKFNKNNAYIMRFRGMYKANKSGMHYFRTQSDDGSRVWINEQMIVDNDGNHGPRTRTGSLNLKAGRFYPITIVFYENGGGAMLRVSVRRPGNSKYVKLAPWMTRSKPQATSWCKDCGMHVDAYKWNSKTLKQNGNPTGTTWNNMVPIITHTEHSNALWYNNDQDFAKEIPGFSSKTGSNRYMMRFKGYFVCPKAGTYRFRTRSDDGSQLWIRQGDKAKDYKLIVNNDGNHGMRTREGNAKLKKGWNQMTITFYENGGGAGLQVSVRVKKGGNGVGSFTGPGSTWMPITSSMTRTLYQGGLRLDVFHYKTGVLADYEELVHDNGWKPAGQNAFLKRWSHQKSVWYSNDKDFQKDIPKFKKNDKYIMRFRGQYKAETNGRYYFRTRSDDGSRLYIDRRLIVDNDRNHGMRTRTSSVVLKKGFVPITIVFYENGGGAGLQVSVNPPGRNGYQRLDDTMTRALPDVPDCYDCGLHVEVYRWKGKYLSQMGSHNSEKWDGQIPVISHNEHASDVWYSNDKDFAKEIPGFSSKLGSNKYAVRFQGYYVAPRAGTYWFMTRSDDGSMLYMREDKAKKDKLIINNDKNHGMQTRTGKAKLKKGWNKMVITFYENGGGAGLQVAVKLNNAKNGPGGTWNPLNKRMLKPIYRLGMRFEAYHYKSGKLADWPLNVHTNGWRPNGQKAFLTHWSVQKPLWYSNDKDFQRAIPKFKKNDKYVMRFRGQFEAVKAGTHRFQTRSDDGSMLFIDNHLVVNNDGNHGMRVRTGDVKLTKGWHPINVIFYENGGGAGLQVSVRRPGGTQYERFTKSTTRAKPEVIETGNYGLYVDVYRWDEKTLSTRNSRRNMEKWYKDTLPVVSHVTHATDLWYSNDDDFAKEIPGFSSKLGSNKYAVRFRGYYVAPKDGTYEFMTKSDDGSQLWIRETIKKKQQKTEKLIVNNDGNHGMQVRTGKAICKKGWNKLIVMFYENGGGAGLQVAVRLSKKGDGPGSVWTPLDKKKLRPLYGKGLRFEAYNYKGGKLLDWSSTVHYTTWKPNGQNAFLKHWSHSKALWYSNDKDFVKDISKFKKNDKYVMRFRGQYMAGKDAVYQFQTVSDDGSLLYVDQTLVVENDGNHGPRARAGTIKLTKGWHALNVVFYENGGGARLQVSVRVTGGQYEKLTAEMTRAQPEVQDCGDCGMYVDVYKWNGQSLGSQNARRNFVNWVKGSDAVVSHNTHASDMWYSNDQDFAKEIPGFSSKLGSNKYMIRFRGYFVAPKTGTYEFMTRSDDGSQLWIRENIKGKQQKTEKLIVNNDGNHGMQTRTGKAQLKKGWNKLIVTFYENGGGAGLQVAVKLNNQLASKATGPGKVWVPVTRTLLKPLFRKGLKFAAYHYKGGSLKSMLSDGSGVHETSWKPNGQNPFVGETWSQQRVLWYSNDNEFKKEIAVFKKDNKYVMRFRGQFEARKTGRYYFKTESDDGSLLYINEKLIVDNDGDHGPRSKTGYIQLKEGWHAINVVFYENGGGARLRVSVRFAGGAYEPLQASMTRAKAVARTSDDYGLYLDAYNWNGQPLKGSKNKNPLNSHWGANKPIVEHASHGEDLWYSNDNDFKKLIPGFNKNNKYQMRFRGYFVAPKAGTYRFKTRSDDGSMLYLRQTDGKDKLIIDNDGNHGMQNREGSAKLKKGWNKIVVTFYENGGGAGLQVSVKLNKRLSSLATGPGNYWVPLSKDLTRPIYRYGLRFEAYNYVKGTIAQFQDAKNIHKTTWKPAGKNPIVKHWSHSKSLWYSNGNDFKNEIPKFKKNDKYIMRFRGQYEAKTTGNYRFRTRSDDGSRLWIDRKLEVNNDGNHGMRTKDSGNVRLTKGWHEINVVFYENGGGSGLEVSVLQPTGGNGGKFEPLTSTMTRAAPKKP